MIMSVAIHGYKCILAIFPLALAITGALLLLWRAHARALSRHWLGPLLWVVVCAVYFAFPITNVLTSQKLENILKRMIRTRLMAVTEADVHSTLGQPEWRQSPSGSAEVQLAYPTSPWWAAWKGGLCISITHDRVTGFNDYE
jgi:hypothetical protein